MIVPVPDQRLTAEQLGSVHFVGIAGAGLSAIARVMLERGMAVSGSDATEAPVLAALRELGATCWVGHAAEHVEGADTVVVSTAVPEDNPEVLAARRLGLRLLPRSAALDSLMSGRTVVAVTGTHGKTTTTSMLVSALVHCGADPSYAIGGELRDSGVNAHAGSGPLFIAEADESDGAFLVYSPQVGVVTNVEADHLDSYGTVAAYRAAFDRFLDRIATDGSLVVCADDPGAARLGRLGADRSLDVLTVGTVAGAQLRAERIVDAGAGARFGVREGQRLLGEIELQVPGRHFVLDAMCALGAGRCLDLDFAALGDGLSRFRGTRRRMERKGQAGGVVVYDSYAHHPSEISADLAAARSLAGAGRLVVGFQPHLVSRTKAFAAEMGQALGLADEVVVLDVYVSREQPDPDVTGAMVAAHVPSSARVVFEPDRERVAGLLVARAAPGDLVLTLGAGDVTDVAPLVLALLDGSADRGRSADRG
jgi:UDP-N-acetylmuramate--alanine ligase